MAPRSKENDTSASFERKIKRAKNIMLAEQVWPLLWLPMGIMGLFVLVSAYGLWPALSPFVHLLALLVFAGALLASFVPLTSIKRADRQMAIRWLEEKSGLPHRPATVLDDELSDLASQPTNRLWQAHKKRARHHVKAMKTGLPQPRTALIDPFALRVPLMLALAVTLGLRAPSIVPGFWQAFTLSKTALNNDLRIDAWVAPPPYTGKPPIMLVDGAKSLNLQTVAQESDENAARSIKLPEMSELVVRVSGPDAHKTRLVLRTSVAEQKGPARPATGAKPAPDIAPQTIIKQDGAVLDMRAKLLGSIDAELHMDGAHLKTWHFVVTKDHPPAITLLKKPRASPRGALQVSYRVADDYGVIEASAHISKSARRAPFFGHASKSNAPQAPSSPAPGNLMPPLGTPITFPLLLPQSKQKRGNASTYKDLTAHPWAGLDVELVLVARDEAGKSGESSVARFKLPERKFTKALAQAIIKERRHLVEKPYEHRIIAKNLDAMSHIPLSASAKKIEDKSVFLALRSAYWRLQGASKRHTIRSVVDQLWEIALTIEDGNLSKAERELRSAQDRLMDALSRNAPPKEIAQLMKELRQALSNFLQAMAKNQQKQNAEQQQMPGNQRTLSAKQLDKMLKDIENMAKTGARDAARQMLSQLRNMLENLSSGRSAPSAQSQQARKQLDELGKMIMKQRRLLDETHQQNQQRQGNRAGQRQNQRQGQRQDRSQNQRQGQRPGRGARQGQQHGQQQGRQQGQGQQQGSRQGFGSQGQQGGSGDQMQQGGANSLKQRQGELLDGLNGLMDQMGRMGTNIPQDLMRAGSNMGQAENRLSRQQLGSASRQQGKALENLRKGANKLVEQMRRNGQPGQQSGPQNRDPLGRATRTSGPDFGEDVKVPKDIDTRRARDILEELRRRLGQSTRPPDELDYLERLIEQF